MPNSRASTSSEIQFYASPHDSCEESEGDNEVLEESPCGRWVKHREEVDQRDVPGIECAHLAMDTEEGVEVVWNEILLNNGKDLKKQEKQMRQMLENLLMLDHQNIVKFHHYWTDLRSDRPRVIFITECMSSCSIYQFLKRTKKNGKQLPFQSWKRWSRQILSALSYLHSCTPPVIHGNLTCDSVFIQHNGLVKIGSVVPDAIHCNIYSYEEGTNSKYASRIKRRLTPAVDLYSFGLCALEMATQELPENCDISFLDEDAILQIIGSLENEMQRNLIFQCLRKDPNERPSAHDLLFHPLLFEVPSLKLLAAHYLVNSSTSRAAFSEIIGDELMQQCKRSESVMAVVPNLIQEKEVVYRMGDVPTADKLEKFVEDVRFGVHPVTAFTWRKPPIFRTITLSPDVEKVVNSPESFDMEVRRALNMMCSVKPKEGTNDLSLTLLLRMDDKMNRQLTCLVSEEDSASVLTNELFRLGFVHMDDQDKICTLLEDTLRGGFPNHQQECSRIMTAEPTELAERNWSIDFDESHLSLFSMSNGVTIKSTTTEMSATSNDTGESPNQEESEVPLPENKEEELIEEIESSPTLPGSLEILPEPDITETTNEPDEVKCD